jgi:hypothetical protein
VEETEGNHKNKACSFDLRPWLCTSLIVSMFQWDSLGTVVCISLPLGDPCREKTILLVIPFCIYCFFLLKQSLMGTMLCAKANVCVVILINPYGEWLKIKCLFYNLLVNHTCLLWQLMPKLQILSHSRYGLYSTQLF